MVLRRLLDRRFFFFTYPDKESFAFHAYESTPMYAQCQYLFSIIFALISLAQTAILARSASVTLMEVSGISP